MNEIYQTILPIFLLMALGKILIHLKLANENFFQTSDRLVYFIFFPALLFWKVAIIQNNSNGSETNPILFKILPLVLLTIFLLWCMTLFYAKLRGMPQNQIGSFSQVSYRFNTYVGMAVVLSATGEKGVADFAIMISLAIPFINVLAVSTLVWFSPQDYSKGEKIKMVLKAMLTNPLILACLAGVAYNKFAPPLPTFAISSFKLLSSITLPLALLSIGSGLSFAKLKGRVKEAFVACLFKQALLPGLGYLILSLGNVQGRPLAIAMIFFFLPTSTACYILSAQLKSDPDLASAAIVLSTLASFVSLSIALILFT